MTDEATDWGRAERFKALDRTNAPANFAANLIIAMDVAAAEAIRAHRSGQRPGALRELGFTETADLLGM